ncbi:MAG: TRAP transporter small permease subunit [Hyphomicrobiales bacterium]|nr:TRAP transporter small permease subunit [Hyphomicrobiales bacterium]
MSGLSSFLDGIVGPLFDLVGGPKQLPLYLFLLPVPLLLWAAWAEIRAVVGRESGDSVLEQALHVVDGWSAAVGKTYAWSIIVLTFTTSYEVFARYLFLAPTEWAFDASYMLYGTLFMMAGAYALSRNAHVRGDFLYRAWPPRRQAGLDLVLYILFYFPGMIAFVYAGYGFAELSRMMNEHSAASPNGPIVWPFKWLIVVVGVLMVTQGIVEVLRCLICLRRGEWPKRLHDVEELDKVILAEAEQQKQAAIARSDAIATQRGSV